jgi:2-polyprenyl-6-methoxyphenol hydroxylase-like FAD-dependent oxidoreductase
LATLLKRAGLSPVILEKRPELAANPLSNACHAFGRLRLLEKVTDAARGIALAVEPIMRLAKCL